MDSNTLDYWKARAEEAERKLKNACEHCGSIKIWASGCPRCSAPVCCDSCCQIADTERRLHIAERKLAAARAEGMEEAARICEQQAHEPECPERAQHCADAIRAALAEPSKTMLVAGWAEGAGPDCDDYWNAMAAERLKEIE